MPADPALRPRPIRNWDNSFFWDGFLEEKILARRCANCARLTHPPIAMCSNCHGVQWNLEEIDGSEGTVYSYVVMHSPAAPGYDSPYVVGLIQLEKGIRLIAGISGIAPEDVTIGMPVTVAWEHVADDLVLPEFRPLLKA
jgi:uncharacterized OB-fold protein